MHKLILTLAIVCTAGLLLSSAAADQLGSAYGGMFARGTQIVDRNDKVVANILVQGQYIRKIKETRVTNDVGVAKTMPLTVAPPLSVR